ncbi:MAG TPA: ribosome small subunit-dependent GTPase A [Candidatus Dormibacteraeota bacterium]
MSSTDPNLLAELGWNPSFAAALESLNDPTLAPARIAVDYGHRYLVETVNGSVEAQVASHLHVRARLAVGDWVATRPRMDSTQIEALLPRRTVISRKVADRSIDEQVLAANVDVVFLATALGSDFNLRRIERLLTVAYQSGGSPVILLTKSDLENALTYEAQLDAVAPGVPILSVSGLLGEGIDAVRELLPPGRTGVIIGSSGVGKSTLINRLIGDEVLRTSAVHASGQGRHTTSHRELIRIPQAGLIIDTPGLREIQLWAGEEALGQAFSDIEELALVCRFNDCQHQKEPGCAVLLAISDGTLDQRRYDSYRKLQRELRSIEVRADARLRLEERRKRRVINRAATERMNAKRRLG